jgi:AcrR family transcriptional regulator
MNWQLQIQMNEKLFLKDPAGSELGKRIVQRSAHMINRMGLEEFTFKKLAVELATNESSIYRYFENKHRLLLYLAGWYWRWMEYLVVVHTTHVKSSTERIEIVLKILLHQLDGDVAGDPGVDKNVLRSLIIKENAKAYLTNHVAEDNRQLFFKPYKDLCGRIAEIFMEFNPTFRYSRSLASTVMQMAHQQHFFMHNLPSLTDFGQVKDDKEIFSFLRLLILSVLSYQTDKS